MKMLGKLLLIVILIQPAATVKAGPPAIIGMPQLGNNNWLLGQTVCVDGTLPIIGLPNTVYSVIPARRILGEVPAYILTDATGYGMGFGRLCRQEGELNEGDVFLMYYRGDVDNGPAILRQILPVLPYWLNGPFAPPTYLVNNGMPVRVD